MKVSLRTQFFFMIVPFAAGLVALLLATLGPYLAVQRNVRNVQRELAYTKAIRTLAASFTSQTREYSDYIVSADSLDVAQSDTAAIESLESLKAWQRLAVDDAAGSEVVREVTRAHARVTELGSAIVRLRREGQQKAAVTLLVEEVLPLTSAISSTLDQNMLEHQDAVSRNIERISGVIDSSGLLPFGVMQQQIEELDAHTDEVVKASTYSRAIEKELHDYWLFFISNGRLGNESERNGRRVSRAFTAWRQAVAAVQVEADELRMVDEVQLGYLVLHRNGERVVELVGKGSTQEAQDVLRKTLEFENTATAKDMQRYEKHEAEISARALAALQFEADRYHRTFLIGSAIVLLIALGIPLLLSGSIINPMIDLQEAALRIGAGDLDTQVQVPRTIELASLAATFNEMTRELKASRDQDLQKSEERFQLATRATLDMIWDFDAVADHLWQDSRFCEHYGDGSPIRSTADFTASMHPDDRHHFQEGLEAVLIGSDSFWSDDYRFLRRDGTYADMSDRGYVVRDARGRAVRMIGAISDVTERRKSEATLAALHRHKEMILNSVADGIIGVDREGKITSVNPAAVEMLGCTEEELLGVPIDDVFHRRAVDGVAPRWEDSPINVTLVEGMLQSSDAELAWRADGSSFAAEYVSNPMCDDYANVLGAVITFRDITERHEVDRLKSQFVSTVSHELRTPLTSIRGALGLLSGGLLGSITGKGQRMLEIAVSNTDRLIRLINDILDVERVEGETMKMSSTSVDAFDLMKRTVEGVQAMADSAGVRLTIEPTTAHFLGDADRIHQTLTNLVGNAIKFSPPDTTVTLGASSDGAKCTFRVADQGRGVPASKLEMIFERFQQVDASDSRDKGGSGLGLAICRSIVEAHGGRIWAERNEPVGTLFRFTLPVAIAPLARGAGSVPRTLVVCQESDSAMPGIVTILEDYGFHVVRCAEEDIASQVARSQPDAVVLDLASNGGNGWRVIEALKANAETRDVPIVVATMQSPESWENYSAAVASWVHRPFGTDDLLNAVAEACSAPSILVVEDDEDLARVMTAILQDHGIRTFHAANGREAVDLCRQHEPSLIVLDLVLPDMDGFAVVDSLKENSTLRRIPLLVYSGMDVNAADQVRLKLGPTEFLTKSRSGLEEFERRVARLLDSITSKEEASFAA
jgi:PAS domain S-box-containing protein